MKLVQNRECDNCSACCTHIPIDQDDFVKLPNVDCENLLKGGGCRIYKNRPTTCATWYCAWRYISTLSENWRPDKCGTLMDFNFNAIKEENSADKVFTLKVIDIEKFFSNPELAPFVIYLLKQGVQVSVSHGLELGYSAISAMVNDLLADAVKNNDHEAVIKELKWLLKKFDDAPKNTLKIRNGSIEISNPIIKTDSSQ